MKYYNIDKAKDLAIQPNLLILGRRGAGRRNFEIAVKGKGKSNEEKLAIADSLTLISVPNEETLVVDPEEEYIKACMVPTDVLKEATANTNDRITAQHQHNTANNITKKLTNK